MVDVAVAVQPRARERTDLVSARGVTPGRVRAGHRPSRRQRRPARAAAGAGSAAAVGAAPVVAAAAPADRGAAARRRAVRALERGDNMILTPPLGYIELDRAAVQRARRADRFGRPPEGGLSGGGAVHHDAAEHGVDRDRRSWLERAGRPRRRGGGRRRSSASRPRTARSCTATDMREIECSLRLTLHLG